jgi:cytochrome P450
MIMQSESLLSILYGFLSFKVLFLLSVLGLVYKFVIKPYLMGQYYAKQGGKVTFKVGLGSYAIHKANVVKHGDFYHWHKGALQEDPNIPFLVSNVLDSTLVTILEPALIKEFILKPEKYMKAKMISGVIGTIAGKGLVFKEGHVWKKQRKIISQILHYEFYQEMLPIILQAARESFDKLAQRKDLSNINLRNEFDKITGEVVGRVFFGDSLFEVGEVNGNTVTTELSEISSACFSETYGGIAANLIGAWFVRAGILPKHRELMNRIKHFMAFCRKFVAERRKAFNNPNKETKITKRKDLLEQLFEAQKNDPENYMDDEEIVHEFNTFFIAGMDTTSQLLTMSTLNLLLNPEYMPEAKKDAKEILANESQITTNSLSQVSFLTALLRETLRLAPPGSNLFQRTALEDHKLGKLSIKKGTLVTVGLKIMAMNPKYFEDPFDFKPLRWLDGSFDEKAEPYAYMPFSTGARNCIGQGLALMETKLVISEFLTRFEVKLKPEYVHRMTVRFVYEHDNPVLVDLALKDRMQ